MTKSDPPRYECEDQYARRTIMAVRDEAAENYGRMMAAVSRLESKLDALLDRAIHVNGHHDSRPSFSDLVEEVTGSHHVTHHPVQAALERFVGKQALRVVKLTGIGLLGFLGHWLWTVIWAALHK